MASVTLTPAWPVLGGPRVELVGRELALAAQQLEMFRRHDEMQKTLLGADRAVTLPDVRQVGGDAKSNPPAMAAPFERSHALHPFSARAHRHATGCRSDAGSDTHGVAILAGIRNPSQNEPTKDVRSGGSLVRKRPSWSLPHGGCKPRA